MGILLVRSQIRIVNAFLSPSFSKPSDNQHICIIVLAWSGSGGAYILEGTDCQHYIPFVCNISCSAPLVSTGLGTPIPYIGRSISYAEDDIPIDFVQGTPHYKIRLLDSAFLRILLDLQITAIIIFEIINSPAGPSPGVNFIVLIASNVSTASRRSGRRINAEF